MLRLAVVSACVLAGACSAGTDAKGGADPSGLVTVFDTTGDSIIAHVAGDVPAGAVRHVTEELRIAPGVDDTLLFTQVYDFIVDRAGRMWVYDTPTNRLFLFAADGKLLKTIGRKGGGPGEFNGDGGMVATSDTGLAIWDPQNARVSSFAASGDFRTSWRTPAGFGTTHGLVTDRSGALFLRRPIRMRRAGEVIGRLGLVKLRTDESTTAPIRASEAIPLGDSLLPPEIDVPRSSYVSTSPDGRASTGTGAQYAPNFHWAWHPDGYFVAAHGGKYEIVLARTQGRPVVIKRDYPRIPVAEEDRKDEEARIYSVMRRTNPSWTWQGPALPEVKAPMSNLFIARDGRIWALAATPSERIPDDQLPPSRPNGPPLRHYRSSGVWEVFSDNGRFLGRVMLPPRTTLVEADGDLLWAITRDEEDLPGVVRLRITPGLQ